MPTGWLFEMKRQLFAVRTKGPCSVHLVPYSEHSRQVGREWGMGGRKVRGCIHLEGACKLAWSSSFSFS